MAGLAGGKEKTRRPGPGQVLTSTSPVAAMVARRAEGKKGEPEIEDGVEGRYGGGGGETIGSQRKERQRDLGNYTDQREGGWCCLTKYGINNNNCLLSGMY